VNGELLNASSEGAGTAALVVAASDAGERRMRRCRDDRPERCSCPGAGWVEEEIGISLL
jgi:hypothetical protein